MDIGSGSRPSGTAGHGGTAGSRTASLIDGLGLRFRETMAGYFSPGETDPTRGAELGRVEQNQLRFDVEIGINDLGRFVKISEHSAELTGTVTYARLGGTFPIRDGVFNLFIVDETTGVRQMVYSFRFTATDGVTYCLQGTKHIHSVAGESNVFADMTRLSTTVYRGDDAHAPVYGAGILVFNLADAPGLVAGMTVENARTPWQKAAAYAAFTSFAWGALRDKYLRPWRLFYDTRYENLVLTGDLQSGNSTHPFFMFSGVHERGFPWGTAASSGTLYSWSAMARGNGNAMRSRISYLTAWNLTSRVACIATMVPFSHFRRATLRHFPPCVAGTRRWCHSMQILKSTLRLSLTMLWLSRFLLCLSWCADFLPISRKHSATNSLVRILSGFTSTPTRSQCDPGTWA